MSRRYVVTMVSPRGTFALDVTAATGPAAISEARRHFNREHGLASLTPGKRTYRVRLSILDDGPAVEPAPEIHDDEEGGAWPVWPGDVDASEGEPAEAPVPVAQVQAEREAEAARAAGWRFDDARAAWGCRTIKEGGRHRGIWYGYQGADYVRSFDTEAEALAWRNAPAMVQQPVQQQQGGDSREAYRTARARLLAQALEGRHEGTANLEYGLVPAAVTFFESHRSAQREMVALRMRQSAPSGLCQDRAVVPYAGPVAVEARVIEAATRADFDEACAAATMEHGAEALCHSCEGGTVEFRWPRVTVRWRFLNVSVEPGSLAHYRSDRAYILASIGRFRAAGNADGVEQEQDELRILRLAFPEITGAKLRTVAESRPLIEINPRQPVLDDLPPAPRVPFGPVLALPAPAPRPIGDVLQSLAAEFGPPVTMRRPALALRPAPRGFLDRFTLAEAVALYAASILAGLAFVALAAL